MSEIVSGKRKFYKGREKMIKQFGLKSFGQQFAEGIKTVSGSHRGK